MRKLINCIILFVCLFATTNTYAQSQCLIYNSVLDSLSSILQRTVDDSSKVYYRYVVKNSKLKFVNKDVKSWFYDLSKVDRSLLRGKFSILDTSAIVNCPFIAKNPLSKVEIGSKDRQINNEKVNQQNANASPFFNSAFLTFSSILKSDNRYVLYFRGVFGLNEIESFWVCILEKHVVKGEDVFRILVMKGIPN